MEKVRPWCGQPSDRGRLRNRTERGHIWPGPTTFGPTLGALISETGGVTWLKFLREILLIWICRLVICGGSSPKNGGDMEGQSWGAQIRVGFEPSPIE